jgi:hypothetical protein
MEGRRTFDCRRTTESADRLWDMRARAAVSVLREDKRVVLFSKTLTWRNMPLQIKFDHSYPKLYGQTSGRLLSVELKNRADLSDRFVLYDTHYVDERPDVGVDGYYELPKGLCLVLYFVGSLGIPFSTVRRATGNAEIRYRTNIGKTFEICMVKDKEAAIDLPRDSSGEGAGNGQAPRQSVAGRDVAPVGEAGPEDDAGPADTTGGTAQ